MLLVPYRVDVPLYRWPIANFVILGLLVVCFGWELSVAGNQEAIAPFILDGWRPLGLVGHMFLHGGFFHLVGNLIFLWVFGNAVCGKVGNVAYPFIFLGLGILAGVVHLLFAGGKAIGASGAINGIVGMFFVWFPLNTVSTFYFFWIFLFIRYGWFDVSSYWIILLWLAFDVLGAMLGGGGVAYWGHLGGFAAGCCLACILTKLKWVSIDKSERTLLDIFGLTKRQGVPASEDDGFSTRLAPQGASSPWPDSTSDRAEEPAPARPGQASVPRPSPVDDVGAGLPSSFKVRCKCGKILQVNRADVGKFGRCPACGITLRIPEG